MPILGLLLEIGSVFFILRWLKKHLFLGLANLSLLIQAKNELFQTIEGRLKYIQDHNQALANSIETESAIYEVSKELSKSTDETSILSAFKEKISGIFNTQEFFSSDDQLIKNNPDYSLFRFSAKEQETRYLAIKDSGKIDRARMAVLLNQLELSLKRSRLFAEVQELSITDGLTGLYARGYFLERFKQELVRSKYNNYPLSFLLIDADNFKTYNDTYGHITGDAILKEIAKILKYSLRQIDMCARYGGEELCILLPETNKEGSLLVAQRLRLSVEEARIRVFNENIRCTVSIGVASYPDDAQSPNGLIDQADKALYQAKAQGRNRVCSN
jgi:diguanylate cyclase (GGDEF)-like protein